MLRTVTSVAWRCSSKRAPISVSSVCAGIDLEAATGDLPLVVGRHHVDQMLALGQPLGIPAIAELAFALAGQRHIVEQHLHLADAARLVVARLDVEVHVIEHVLPIDNPVDRHAHDVDRHQTEHGPHALALFRAVLSALHRAPRAVVTLMLDQPRRGTRNRRFAIAMTGQLERVQRLPGGQAVAGTGFAAPSRRRPDSGARARSSAAAAGSPPTGPPPPPPIPTAPN